MGRAISNLIVLAMIAGGVYYLWNWQFGSAGNDEAASYAETSCVDAIRSRYDTTTVKANSVRENANGFVVRATMTLARGDMARATCLTNDNGTVRDIVVDER